MKRANAPRNAGSGTKRIDAQLRFDASLIEGHACHLSAIIIILFIRFSGSSTEILHASCSVPEASNSMIRELILWPFHCVNDAFPDCDLASRVLTPLQAQVGEVSIGLDTEHVGQVESSKVR